MEWQVNQEIVAQAFSLLQALRDPTRPDHRTALKTMEDNVTQPLFILHILHIFAQGYQYEASGLGVDIRQLAGFIIKNYVFPHLQQLSEEVQTLMKTALLQALHDTVLDIRRTAAILIGKITESFPAAFWINMIPTMVENLDVRYLSTQPYSVDGHLTAMLHICEDSASKLAHAVQPASPAEDIPGSRPLDYLVPKLLELLSVPEPTIRVRALQAYNCLLYLLDTSSSSTTNNKKAAISGLRSRNTSMDSERLSSERNSFSGYATSPPPSSLYALTNNSSANIAALIIHMHTFIQQLGALSQDTNGEVRKTIVMSITIIAFFHVSLLEPFFVDICTFMLNALYDAEESVAIESCEYWHALLATADTRRAMQPFLPKLIEALIARLRLSEEQLEYERRVEDEEHRGTKAVSFHSYRASRRRQFSFHPQQQQSSSSSAAQGGYSTPSASQFTSKSTQNTSGDGHHSQTASQSGYDAEDGGHHGGGGEDAAKAEEEASSTWTLRKQAALTLDTFAKAYAAGDILRHALPIIQHYLSTGNTHWPGSQRPPDATTASSSSASPDPFVQESGMLALGCLSQGCLSAMMMHMPQLVPLWCSSMDAAALPEMRAIVCWVISRYCPLLEQAATGVASDGTLATETWFTPAQAQEMYLMCVNHVLQRVFDPVPRVQVAAISALSLLISHSFDDVTAAAEQQQQQQQQHPEGSNVLLPLLPTLFTAIVHALDHGGVKSSLLLVDLLGTMADTFKEAIAVPAYTHMYMPKLITLFQRYDHPGTGFAAANVAPPLVAIPAASAPTTGAGSRLSVTAIAKQHAYDARLFPILECFTSLFAVLGMEAQAYLPFVYERMVLILLTTLPTPAPLPTGTASAAAAAATSSSAAPMTGSTAAGLSLASPAAATPVYGVVLPPLGGSLTVPDMQSFTHKSGYHDRPSVHERHESETVTVHEVCDDDEEEDDDDEDDDDDIQKDFAICAFDVLSAMAEGIQGQMFALVGTSYDLLWHCIVTSLSEYSRHHRCHPQLRRRQYYIPELIQSAFSLAGELIKSTFPSLVQGHMRIATPEHLLLAHSTTSAVATASTAVDTAAMASYLTLCLHFATFHLEQQDYLEFPFLYNNAAWVLGELLLQLLAHVDVIPAAQWQVTPSPAAMAAMAAMAANSNSNSNSNSSFYTVDVLVDLWIRPYLPMLLPAMSMAMQTCDVPDVVRTNVAISLGRVALVVPMDVAEAVADDCFAAWCSLFHTALTPSSGDLTYASGGSNGHGGGTASVPLREKLQAFLGMFLVLRVYPELICANKTNLYAWTMAVMAFEMDLPSLMTAPSPSSSAAAGSSTAAEATAAVTPTHIEQQWFRSSDRGLFLLDHASYLLPLAMMGPQQWSQVLQGLRSPTMIRQVTLWQWLVGEFRGIFAHIQQQAPPLWTRVWTLVKQQGYDTTFFVQTFGVAP